METKTKIIYFEEYEDDVYIDVLALGKEVFLQPTLYEKYSRYVTHLEAEKDDLQADYDLKVDLDSLEIREDPEEFGIPKNKVTETAIKSVVNVNDEIQKMKKDLRYLTTLIKEGKGALRAIEAKGNSLKSAVSMYITGYWGELTAIPKQMQDSIDSYLDTKDMEDSLKTNKRLLKRSEKHGKKEK